MIRQSKIKCFDTIDKYILFGGGALLLFTVNKLKDLGLQVFVVTSERHSKEVHCINLKENTLLGWLDDENTEYIISQNITFDERVLNVISETTIGLSFGAAWIFKQEFINRFNGNLLNLHGAQLPKNRGGGGFSYRIMQGDKVGVSLIHKVDAGVDTGSIVLSEEYTFPKNCKVPLDFQEYSVYKYRGLLDAFFNKVKNLESFHMFAQEERFSSYWPRLATGIHGFIDWSWMLMDIESFACAFDEPYTGASTFINEIKVRVKDCYSCFDDGTFHPFQQGLIYRKNDESVFVATTNGSLIINHILDEQGQDIKQQLKVGDRFYTPQKFIEESMQFRAVYTPTGLKEP